MLYRPGDVLLGSAYLWGSDCCKPVGMKCSRHLFMFAMTGAGKTVSLVTLVSLWLDGERMPLSRPGTRSDCRRRDNGRPSPKDWNAAGGADST